MDSIATEGAIIHIIHVAQDLKLGLVADGVETEEQLGFLVRHHVACGQDWLFAKPMPWGELVAEMKGRQPQRNVELELH